MTEINHMDLLTRRELEELLREDGTPLISIFLPTHRLGAEMQQDPIRLKNLLHEAETQLEEKGVRHPEAGQLLEPARRLLDEPQFWRHQNEGLAVFISPERLRTYRLPLGFDDLVEVGERFHTKPLLPLLTGDGQFYVLALSQGGVRLLQGTRYTISQVELADVPESLGEALGHRDFERQLQFRTGTGPRGGRQGAIFHGHGVGVDDAKEEVLGFFRRLDRGLREAIRDEHLPLVLAGVDFLLPLYREANTYPHLAEGAVLGNPEERSGKELHEASWQVVEPLFARAQQEAAEEYQRLAGTGRTGASLEEVVSAACYGRVAALFVPIDRQAWGTYRRETGEVRLHEAERPGSEDLLDLAAAQTILNSGEVFAVEAEAMPNGRSVAAVYRY